jgi:hypothetical protein
MSVSALTHNDTKSVHLETPRSKARENFKIALGAIAALITGCVLLAIFSNPFLITLGVVLLVGGSLASDHLFWQRFDTKLAEHKCGCAPKGDNLGLELGAV